MEGGEDNFPYNKYIPIGIVVVPSRHGVLKDGSGKYNHCGVMSLKYMYCNDPSNGDTSGEALGADLIWGHLGGTYGYGSDISDRSDKLGRYDSITNGLINYNGIITSEGSFYNNTYMQIPMQFEVGGIATTSKEIYGPSPYLDKTTQNMGDYNELYGSTIADTDTDHNVLADFGGIVNTKIITDLATGQSNWRTSSITNSSEYFYFPAACCCARYKTTGTKAFIDCTNEELYNGTGFWYMPSIGELGYIIPRFADINNVISNLAEIYNKPYSIPIIMPNLKTTRSYYASNEWNKNANWAICLNPNNWGITNWNRGYRGNNTLAFMQLNPNDF